MKIEHLAEMVGGSLACDGPKAWSETSQPGFIQVPPGSNRTLFARRRADGVCLNATRGPRRGRRGASRGGNRPRRHGGGKAGNFDVVIDMEPKPAIQRQVEYYFCEENLRTDDFLQRNLDGDGFCSINIISTFARIRIFTAKLKDAGDPRPSEELIADAIRESPYLEVGRDSGHLQVRRVLKYSLKDISGGVPVTVKPSRASSSTKEERGAPCKYHFAGYCDRGSRCPNTHNMDYCDAIERQWMNPIGSGSASKTGPLVDKLKKICSQLGLSSPSLSYASKMVRSKLDAAQARTVGERQAFDYFVVIDIEGQHEIIEFPAIVFSTKGLREVGRFHRWVKPVNLWRGKSLNPRSDSVPFSQVLKEFEAYLRELGLVGRNSNENRFAMVCCGNWDVKTQIPKQCKLNGVSVPRYMRQWINIKDVFNEVYVSKTKATGMKAMLRRSGLVGTDGAVEGVHHLGMHDTENITRILLRLLEQNVQIGITGKL
ncbi:hypothetical protein NDN08_008386 [Rhodosorus marinus]|uniref:C3H1-type domain-containing protein n=1 Tax=Rhodosorus marinus TaxID=101924 RepID=A0AAV8V099_9RHOD|nr:hypothetical protein NDN08_008386 [Rhodosorus marinus]